MSKLRKPNKQPRRVTLDEFIDTKHPGFRDSVADLRYYRSVIKSLVQRRQSNDLSVADIAHYMGIDPAEVETIEASDSGPDFHDAMAYARACGCRLEISIVGVGQHRE